MNPFSKPCFWLILNHYGTIQTISDRYWWNHCGIAQYLRDSSRAATINIIDNVDSKKLQTHFFVIFIFYIFLLVV